MENFPYTYEVNNGARQLKLSSTFINDGNVTIRRNVLDAPPPDRAEVFSDFIFLAMEEGESHGIGTMLTMAEARTLRDWLSRLLERFPEAQV